MEKTDRLACVKHADGATRIYLTDAYGKKKYVNGDDSFFVAIPFSEENSRALCELIAHSHGMNAISAGQGSRSFLFDLV